MKVSLFPNRRRIRAAVVRDYQAAHTPVHGTAP